MQATANVNNIQALFGLSTEEFVNRVIQDHPELSGLRQELTQSNVTACHVAIRVAPERLSPVLFKRLIDAVDAVPGLNSFLPTIGRDWSGERVSEWLLASGYIDQAKFDELSGQIDGRNFLEGRVFPFLAQEDIRRVAVSHESFLSSLFTRPNFNFMAFPEVQRLIGAGSPIECVREYQRMSALNVPTRFYNLTTRPSELGQRAYSETAFIDVYGEARNFLRYVRKMKESSMQMSMARYGYLGQSSGIGKTKLLRSTIHGDNCALLTLYLMCPPPINERNVFPVYNVAHSRIAQELMRVTDLMALKKLLTVVLYEALTALTTFDEPTQSYRLRSTPSCHDLEDLSIDFSEYTALSDDRSSLMKLRISEIADNLFHARPSVITVLAIDEAAALIDNPVVYRRYTLNRFLMLRDALKELEFFRLVPTVFAGTNTSISNFLQEEGTRLAFPPFILTESWDVFSVYQQPPTSVLDWNRYLTGPNHLFHMCNFGRPLWGAMMKTGLADAGVLQPYNRSPSTNIGSNNDAAIREIFERISRVAIGKLDLGSPLTSEDALCIIGLTARFDWSFGSFGNSLVARRMAFLLDYLPSSNFSEVAYLPEPVLSLAAMSILREKPCEVLSQVFSASEQTLKDVGAMGEFISRTLLLLCLPVDQSTQFRRVHSSCRGFLINMFGRPTVNRLSENQYARSMMDGLVSFSSWHQVEIFHPDPVVNLGYAVILHQAIIMPPRYPGVDLAIPVILPSGKLGCILVQVKSWTSRLSTSQIDSIAEKMTCPELTVSGSPILRVILNVGSDSNFSNPPTVLNRREPVVVIDGLATAFHAVYRRYVQMKDVLEKAVKFGRYRAVDSPILKYKSVRRNMVKSVEQQEKLEALLIAGNLTPQEALLEVGDSTPSFCINLERFYETPVGGEDFYIDPPEEPEPADGRRHSARLRAVRRRLL